MSMMVVAIPFYILLAHPFKPEVKFSDYFIMIQQSTDVQATDVRVDFSHFVKMSCGRCGICESLYTSRINIYTWS